MSRRIAESIFDAALHRFLPAELAAAREQARAARLAANRAMSCDRCLGQQASLPVVEIPP
jgi:hypothetical protein